MTPFTIVGMPGSGKSSVTQALAQKYNMPVISTDATIFKEARKDPFHPVTAVYISTFEDVYGCKLEEPALLMDMPAFIARYSEKSFRDLEEQAVIHAFETGRMNGVIPDLSGSGFMRPLLREALKRHGVVSIYLDVPDSLILRHLMKDYEGSLRTGQIKRSGYFHVAKTAAQEGRDPAEALDAYSRAQRPLRVPHYALADRTVEIFDTDDLKTVIAKVEQTLQKSKRLHDQRLFCPPR